MWMSAEAPNCTPADPCRCTIGVPHWRWFVLVTVVLVVVGIALRISIPICRQQLAARELERAGASIEMKPGGPDWLRHWVGDRWMRPFDDVNDVDAHGMNFTDADLVHLKWLGHVEQLWLDGTL